jgi:DNA modification methylase
MAGAAAIVWVKPNARPESVLDRLAQRHEMVFVLARATEEAAHTSVGWSDEPNVDEVWSIPAPRSRWGHVAAGPLALAQRCVQSGCRPGGTVLDPFCGSGTTGVAARDAGCEFIGVDLDQASCEVTWQRLTDRADSR